MRVRQVFFCAALMLALPARADLLIHLPFDTDGKDASGAAHHATAHGGAGIDRTVFQLGGGAANFDGTNSFFNIPGYTPVGGGAARSISLWVRGPARPARIPNVIFVGWGDSRALAFARCDLGLDNHDNGRLRVEFNNDPVVSDIDPISLLDGIWHQVVVTFDGKAVRFYVDGRQYGGALTPKSPPDTGGSAIGTVIGTGTREADRRPGAGSRFHTGQIDDLGIWDTALSSTEVALINGLGRIGDNDLRWLEAARKLWEQPPGRTAQINGRTWSRVTGLAGRAGDWVQAGGPNRAGSYVVLDDRGGGLRITPLWWEGLPLQWIGWLTLAAGTLLLVFWSADRMRMRVRIRRLESQEATERERHRIARDLHDDLGSGLTEIMLLGDLAAKETLSADELRARLAGITGKMRELIAAVDEIVWTANPVNDVLPKLADYLSAYAQRFLAAKGIACRIEVKDGMPAVPISAGVRHHLLLAVKEALNNAVKHSGAGEVQLAIRHEADELFLVIGDNGRGFDSAAAGPGDGLGNMRSRMAELGGRTEIATGAGRGTQIRFRLPLKSTAV